MHFCSKSEFDTLIQSLDSPEHIDLEEVRRGLAMLAARWNELSERAQLYEDELQRELRAKIDLCGGVPGCPDADSAIMLDGPELLAARRAASLQFNRVFCMAPLTRNCRAGSALKTGSRHPENEVRLRAQINL